MKKKNLNILLLIAVVVVWYLITDRIIEHFKADDKVVSFVPSVVNRKEDADTIRTAVFHDQLIFNNKSPFLMSKSRIPSGFFKADPKPQNDRAIERITEKENDFINAIKYLGVIKNPRNEEHIGLVEVGGRLFQVKAKGILSDTIKIDALNRNNIIIKVNNKTKVIRRSVN